MLPSNMHPKLSHLSTTHNSSIKGCRYTSTLEDVINSFLGIIKVNIMNYYLATNQGGRLQFNKIISPVESHEFKSPNGLTPPNANLNLMLCGSFVKSSHFSSICFQLLEFGTLHIRPFELDPFLCQTSNLIKFLQLYIRSNLGIKGKCQSTFCGVNYDPSTNLLLLHFGHTCDYFKLSPKRTQPFGHAWIES